MCIRHPLLLVRHAQAEHHIRGITGGWTDTGLTEHGFDQSTLLAERLKRDLDGTQITLITSNLRRAMQTAAILGATLGLAPQVCQPLTDLNNGLAAGKTHSEARQIAIPPSHPILDWQPYPEAESWRQFHQRITGFIHSFTHDATGPTLLVTHAAVIDVVVGWWLGMTVDARVHFEAAPASLTMLGVSRWGEQSIERLNDTAHLYASGIYNPLSV